MFQTQAHRLSWLAFGVVALALLAGCAGSAHRIAAPSASVGQQLDVVPAASRS